MIPPSWEDLEHSVMVRGGPASDFLVIKIFTEGLTDLPRDAMEGIQLLRFTWGGKGLVSTIIYKDI